MKSLKIYITHEKKAYLLKKATTTNEQKQSQDTSKRPQTTSKLR